MQRILIIDDSQDDLEWLKEITEKAGDFSVACVESGAAGLSEFKKRGADCVLLDYRLEGEDGLAVLAQFKSISVFTPVIILTGQGSGELAARSAQSGAAAHMTKGSVDGPVLAQAIQDAIKEAEKRKKSAVQVRHVLLVEDNDDDRMQIEEMILSANGGVQVEAVATGTEALAYFAEHGTDCVILDYRLEAEDGLDVLEAMKKLSPFTPVIMLTGQGNEEVAASSIKVGAADYLVKQRLNETYLRTSIDNAISRSALEAKVAEQEQQRRQFLNILVHDLRAPLRHVRQLGQLATEEADKGDPRELKDLLASQATVATRASDLISTLENYSLLDGAVEYRRVSLKEMASAAADNLATIIFDRNAEVIVRDMPSVLGNEPQLIQLFQNLISNSIKYNKSSKPTVIVEREDETEDRVVVVVKDNGIGIPKQYLEAIFAPLKRLWSMSDYEGTGLGLATCRKVVERHNGTIWCTSTEDQGSEFHIRFPAVS